MEEITPLAKQLADMLHARDFTALDAFKNQNQWQSLTPQERFLLSKLLVIHGEQQLKVGDAKVLESFELASKVAPEQPLIFYQQAVAYASQKNNMRCLSAACKALEHAITLDPLFIDAWYGWGVNLLNLGAFHGEAIYFQEAHHKFEQSHQCALQMKRSEPCNLYWHWALAWHYLGKLSGEPHDFHRAVDKFRRIQDMKDYPSEFWNDYGNAVAELAASSVYRQDLFLEAINFYRKAVSLSPDHLHGWLNLGCCAQKLFEATKDYSYFDLSNDAFARAASLNETSSDLWLHWGKLLVQAGKLKDNIDYLHQACEKFARADHCDPNHPVVLSRWGEAQILISSHTESLELLRQAEEKIVRSLEVHSDSPDAWYIYGSCLTELGRYFETAEFYEQAIEKFRYGLSLNKNHVFLWHGLSLAHFALGELSNDSQMIEQASRYCSKMVECNGPIYPQFWNDWGVTLMKLGEMTSDSNCIESAIEKFERALGRGINKNELHECDLEWLYNYGCAYDFLGDFTGDEADYEKAIYILSYVHQQDPSSTQVRYNLALALSHLGETMGDVDCYDKALEHFEILLSEDGEDEAAWNEWGTTLLSLSQLVVDPAHPEYCQKLYSQAEEKLLHAVALGCNQAFYHLACLYSLKGNYSAAMHFIERSESAHALPPIEDVLHDDWLVGLRETTDFRQFIALLSNKQEQEKP